MTFSEKRAKVCQSAGGGTVEGATCEAYHLKEKDRSFSWQFTPPETDNSKFISLSLKLQEIALLGFVRCCAKTDFAPGRLPQMRGWQ